MQNDDDADVNSEINMVPLIDIMLVLLIIFIITVPVMKHAVNIDLPRASAEAEPTKPQIVRLSIQSDGQYLIDQQPVTDEELAARLQLEGAKDKDQQPDLHIRGDKNVRYERVAQAMAAAQNAGVRKIGFVTEPEEAAN